MAKAICGYCDNTNGVSYFTYPPKVKCTVTGEYRHMGDKCNVKKTNRCAACGVEIAEGTHICSECEKRAKSD